MTPQEIKSALSYNAGSFPLEAMTEALAQREAMTPILLDELDRMAEHPQELVEKPDSYMLHIFAMYLLAQFREIRALPPLVKICHLPQDDLDFLLGDVITEDLGRILASVCGNDIAPIKGIIENEDSDEFVRGAAGSALLTLVAEGAMEREVFVDYLRELHGKLQPDSSLWTFWVLAANDIYPEELLPEIRAIYNAELVDTMFLGMNDIERTMSQGKEATLASLRRFHHYIDDAAGLLERWACFREDADDDVEVVPTSVERPFDLPMPYFRLEPKVGRNDPCPCGSGKKYKKCCMQ